MLGPVCKRVLLAALGTVPGDVSSWVSSMNTPTPPIMLQPNTLADEWSDNGLPYSVCQSLSPTSTPMIEGSLAEQSSLLALDSSFFSPVSHREASYGNTC